jgi:hypothetical protein
VAPLVARLAALPLVLFVVGVLLLIFAGCVLATVWEWIRK